MDNAHRRKKEPERVRQALLDHAARLATEQGLAAVTVQAVAEAAGVTKGGFTHHFPSKQALIDALFQSLLDSLAEELETRRAADPEPHGAFTRAYLNSIFDIPPEAQGGPWAALYVSMLSDPNLRGLWSDWLLAQLERHRATDDDVALAAVRLAADGVWLSDLSAAPMPGRSALRDYLLSLTRP